MYINHKIILKNNLKFEETVNIRGLEFKHKLYEDLSLGRYLTYISTDNYATDGRAAGFPVESISLISSRLGGEYEIEVLEYYCFRDDKNKDVLADKYYKLETPGIVLEHLKIPIYNGCFSLYVSVFIDGTIYYGWMYSSTTLLEHIEKNVLSLKD